MQTLKKIKDFLKAESKFVVATQEVKGYSIDSRTLRAGDLFFAIKGKRDGAAFYPFAKKKGAVGFVLSKKFLTDSAYRKKFGFLFNMRLRYEKNVLYVDDPMKALQKLASNKIKNSGARVIGITGSCGKTTVKELVVALLKKKFKISHSLGNYNNSLGVPLSILNSDLTTDFYVAEMGASKKGDILELLNILQPEIGVLTNISAAHLEGFGSLETVYQTKTELADYLSEKNGVLVSDSDDKTLQAILKDYTLNQVTFGTNHGAMFQATDYREEEEFMIFKVNGVHEKTINRFSVLNIKNVLAALAVSDICGISHQEFGDAFESIQLPPGRFSVNRQENWTLIDDSYNANPASFKNALGLVSKIPNRGRKILVCGEMLELGSESEIYHRNVGFLAAASFDYIIGVGEGGRMIAEGFLDRNIDGKKALMVDSKKEALEKLKKEIQEEDLILLKASRGEKLDELAEALIKKVPPRVAPKKEEVS